MNSGLYDRGRRLGHREGGGVGEAVRGAGDEGVEGVAGVDDQAEGRCAAGPGSTAAAGDARFVDSSLAMSLWIAVDSSSDRWLDVTPASVWTSMTSSMLGARRRRPARPATRAR